MKKSVTYKIIEDHWVEGTMQPGEEIAIKIDQTLCQDATGTLVMLELEAMGLEQTKADVSVQYVDHNLIQSDYKNPDDHLFLESCAQRFGMFFSRAGNGVSHPLHMEHFGKPGTTLAGSDSHTCAAGALGMLAIGSGGLEVAMAICGFPLYIKMPKIWGIELTGKLPDWVSAKDVILEMLRRYDVKGGVGYVLEYYGSGLKHLSAMDRHVIANMGAELGATTSVFPSDKITQTFLAQQSREQDWVKLTADKNAVYDRRDSINLSELQPLIALPSSPGNVVPVSEVEGLEIYQAYIGSSANPGYRDFAIAAEILKHKAVHTRVSFDVNPTSRSILESLTSEGHLANLIRSGARIHQTGCNGCIGMGQAPASGRNSLRTVPRNFLGRSGTKEDSVYLCSPEIAVASALTGKITDPRTLNMTYPKIKEPQPVIINSGLILAPLHKKEARQVTLIKGPNIVSIPELDPLPKDFEYPISLITADNISTDDISPAGTEVLPYRSNIPKISQFTYRLLDPTFVARAETLRDQFSGHIIIGGENYGQGSSREHAALAPRYLGLRVVIAKSFARIHWQNLPNFGILPLTFCLKSDYDELQQEDVIGFSDIYAQMENNEIIATLNKGNIKITLQHSLSKRQKEMILAGGLINWVKQQFA